MVAHVLWEHEVVGSSPTTPTNSGGTKRAGRHHSVTINRCAGVTASSGSTLDVMALRCFSAGLVYPPPAPSGYGRANRQYRSETVMLSLMGRPIVVTNPSDDGDFVTLVEAELARGEPDAAELQRRLRRTHSQAVVRPRGLTGELVEIWYAYRDGHWAPPGGWSRTGGRRDVGRAEGRPAHYGRGARA